VAALAILVGCSKSEPAEKVDPDLVRISQDRVVRHDQVGEGSFETRATYVLVDVENTSNSDLFVTLDGTLIDAAGAEVGPLRAESLRLPEGGRRTFALVDEDNAERPAATDARLEVIGAVVARWSPTTRIQDANVFDDHGKVIAAASVTNGADRPGKIIVLAGFHDAAGKPVARPFTVLEMGAGITQTVRFVGPDGSKTGYIFLGDAVY